MQVRLLEPADEAQWRPLWIAYLASVGRELPADTTRSTWNRFQDPAEPMDALGAFDDAGTMLGFVHLVFHRSAWLESATCYLEDLFVDPACRGRGIGGALLDATVSHAKARHAARLYWITHEDNAAARRVYDRVVPRSGFIHYRMRLTD